ncbi:response regulator [Sphingomonas jeddahensis]|nr:response regulator [Sphingomonas jeddahensis]
MVLIAEDDFYLAEDMADTLREAGAEIIGPAGVAESALALMGDRRPDLAVLDINLGSETSFEIGRRLLGDGVPVLFATGYDASIIPSDLSAAAYLSKPVSMSNLVASMTRLRDQRNRA